MDVSMVTLSDVPDEVREQIYLRVVSELKRLLKEFYPERDIKVEKDGNVFKIFGDLGLKFHN